MLSYSKLTNPGISGGLIIGAGKDFGTGDISIKYHIVDSKKKANIVISSYDGSDSRIYDAPVSEDNIRVHSPLVNKDILSISLIVDGKLSDSITFSRELGDGLYGPDDGSFKVTAVDYISVNGVTRRRILFENAGNNPVCYVEGIGANRDVFMDEDAEYCSTERYLLECYDNDQLIFSMADFGVPQPSFLSVGSVQKDWEMATEEKYSINGIKFNREPTDGIYIMGGKKIAK